MNIIIPAVFLGLMGFIFGAILSFASKKFEVEVDPKINKVLECLPGANCGGCGFPGCSGLANAIVNDGISVDKCVAISIEKKNEIKTVLGQEIIDVNADPLAKKAAVIRCQGLDCEEYVNFEYNGVKSCHEAVLVQNGHWKCPHRCMGLGSCVQACPFGALSMGPNRIPVIDESKCVACGKCVETCPKQIIELAPQIKTIHVLCVSHELGKDTVQMCKVGCIGCGLCKKNCPADAIIIENNLAHIDYAKCNECGKCVEICPRKAIKKEEEPQK